MKLGRRFLDPGSLEERVRIELDSVKGLLIADVRDSWFFGSHNKATEVAS